MRINRRHWTWCLSAPFYARTYDDLAHQLDKDLFAYLGRRTQGAVVADCGCGPGVVTKKFLQRGAGRVFAIDLNAAMLHQVRERLADAVTAGRVVLVHRAADACLFPELRERFLDGSGFDPSLSLSVVCT